MTEKLKPVRPPRTKAEKEAWGKIPAGPKRYPDSAGKRLGGWLVGILTAWKR